VKLTPAKPTIVIGETQPFILSATYADLTTQQISPTSVTWSSDDMAIATVNKEGVATGVAAGMAEISGSYKGNNASTLLTVTVAPSVVIAVRGSSRVLYVTNLETKQEMTFAANGLADSVTMWSGSGEGDGAEISVLPEHGPAWLAIHPTGKYLYVVNHTSASVSAFAIDWKARALSPVVGSPFFAGTKPWSVEVDADGAGLTVDHFHDSTISKNSKVSRFVVDPATGALTSESQ
jgi:DNA-binding beta-propeller fold protein YncE